MRAHLVARSRYAEDALATAVNRGVRQYVLLGAGLDTFAYRNPYPGLRVFEIDHPATQQWKRGLLARNGIPIPPSLTSVPVDFEQQSLERELISAGFDRAAPAFFSWLGVVPSKAFAQPSALCRPSRRAQASRSTTASPALSFHRTSNSPMTR
jgi:methyltransferase (TIGR00027 family)